MLFSFCNMCTDQFNNTLLQSVIGTQYTHIEINISYYKCSIVHNHSVQFKAVYTVT